MTKAEIKRLLTNCAIPPPLKLSFVEGTQQYYRTSAWCENCNLTSHNLILHQLGQMHLVNIKSESTFKHHLRLRYTLSLPQCLFDLELQSPAVVYSVTPNPFPQLFLFISFFISHTLHQGNNSRDLQNVCFNNTYPQQLFIVKFNLNPYNDCCFCGPFSLSSN